LNAEFAGSPRHLVEDPGRDPGVPGGAAAIVAG
jgi:hypothetical protein